MSKLLIAVILVLIIGGAIYFEFRRGSSMQAVANRLGFSFHSGQQPVSESLRGVGFDLFTQGPPNISNRMEGRRGDDRITIPAVVRDRALATNPALTGVIEHLDYADETRFVNAASQLLAVLSEGYPHTVMLVDAATALAHMRESLARAGLSPDE